MFGRVRLPRSAIRLATSRCLSWGKCAEVRFKRNFRSKGKERERKNGKQQMCPYQSRSASRISCVCATVDFFLSKGLPRKYLHERMNHFQRLNEVKELKIFFFAQRANTRKQASRSSRRLLPCDALAPTAQNRASARCVNDTSAHRRPAAI